ncbi:MAG: four-carbon acid sugar kinase family protein [Aureliella sp.]
MSERNTPVLGCVADDITGATDLAINLVAGGMRVVQVMEALPADQLRQLDCDAVVVALKIRSVESNIAVHQAIDATAQLQQAGCKRFFLKYCSTFDSTPGGNIGPIAEAMMEQLGQKQVVFCPAFPKNGRTVYQSHLFVHDRLLHESGMEKHPLNPMLDADLRRLLAAQSTLPVGGVDASAIELGSNSVKVRLEELAGDFPLVILDACSDRHLAVLAEALAEANFVTGGSGIACFLPEQYRKIGLGGEQTHEPVLPDVTGRAVVLSGSCSSATLRQIALFRERYPSKKIEVPRVLADGDAYLRELVRWVSEQDASRPVLLYSTSPAGEVDQLKVAHAGVNIAESIERFQGALAQRLATEVGVRRFVVAGGETSGAVASALGVNTLKIGPEICPGVPWTESVSKQPLALAFKSGNFGSENFFEEALAMLP